MPKWERFLLCPHPWLNDEIKKIFEEKIFYVPFIYSTGVTFLSSPPSLPMFKNPIKIL
jgi:hypothetical protein